jgi:hypothetical protein
VSSGAVAPTAPAGSVAPTATASTVAPAMATPVAVSNPPLGIKVTAYPRNGQSPDQQARDQYDCYAFAVAQSGFDPLRPGNAAASSGVAAEIEFARARAACYESRGYAVR